ncbi:hypothetical protein ACIRPK_15085 [Kitasatospora sp. NPDC101801]|uniref:hypothetical protein n=1 Tax=Kitasatospora sp. NPDC101801 TaxID=3364103 RepID=UPI00381E216E
MTAAQELFAEGMREHFAPALRALGLTDQRGSFGLAAPDHWALLGVLPLHRDTYAVRYTVTLSLTAKADRPGPGEYPDPNAPTGAELWHARIGELMPVDDEICWELSPGPRWLVAVEDSVAAVRHYALPELRRRLAAAAATGPGSYTETYLSPAELEEVNAALLTAAVARIQRAELVDKAVLLTGAWSRSDPVALEVLTGVAEGFLSAGDDRFRQVRCVDSLGRELWLFRGPGG